MSALILAPMVGCLSSILWHEGANTFWKKIDYFPYLVKNIVTTSHHGKEIWVETTQNESYLIAYPCLENQNCWVKQEIPSDVSDNPYIIYKVSNGKCENTNFVYPLLHKIEQCITLIDHAPDATWTTSLAVTDNQELWIWDQPWEDPFSIMINIFWITIVSLVIGILIGVFFLIFNTTKRKGK